MKDSKITVKRNGYDYLVYANGKKTKYEIVRYYDIWTIYKNNKDLRVYNSLLKQAKEEVKEMIKEDETKELFKVIDDLDTLGIAKTNNSEIAKMYKANNNSFKKFEVTKNTKNKTWNIKVIA